MIDLAGKTYWIIGASEGLGRALAGALTAEGARVIVSARNQARLDELVAAGQAAKAIALDATDADAVIAARREAGHVDGLIYAAGVYWPMAAGAWDTKQFIQMAEINYLGAARAVGALLPEFMARDAGHIVLIGSLAGFRGMRKSNGYGSSKAAIMAMGEGLQADLHRTGVTVQNINPGYIETRLTQKNDFAMPFIMSPEDAADEVVKAMKSGAPARNFPRVFSWLFRGSRFFPNWLHLALFGAGKEDVAKAGTNQPAE